MNWKLIVAIAVCLLSLGVAARFLNMSTPELVSNSSGNVVSGLRLIMIHNPQCIHCVRFINEAAPDFESEVHIPLVIVDVSKSAPKWVIEANETKKIDFSNIHGTPTFILYDGIAEHGRIVGYPGHDKFYEELKVLIQAYRENK